MEPTYKKFLSIRREGTAVIKNFFTTAVARKNYRVNGHFWHFYNPSLLRTLEETCADILALEKKTAGLPGEIIGGGK